MKTQTKHRIRIVIASPLLAFLVLSGLIADNVHGFAFWYLGAADRTLDRLSEWIIGDDLERWMGLWEKRLAKLNPDRITLEAVAIAMDCSAKTAQRLCRDATRVGFFATNNDGTYRLAASEGRAE